MTAEGTVGAPTCLTKCDMVVPGLGTTNQLLLLLLLLLPVSEFAFNNFTNLYNFRSFLHFYKFE
jgi:hypothetical protein